MKKTVKEPSDVTITVKAPAKPTTFNLVLPAVMVPPPIHTINMPHGYTVEVFEVLNSAYYPPWGPPVPASRDYKLQLMRPDGAKADSQTVSSLPRARSIIEDWATKLMDADSRAWFEGKR